MIAPNHRDRLLQLGRRERARAVEELLLNKLRGSGYPDSAPGASFAGLEADWEDPERLRDALYPWVREELGLASLHPIEVEGAATVRELAEYLAGELEMPPAPERPLDWDPSKRGDGWFEQTPFRETAKLPARVVFLLGSPRSGTTLFRTLLASHPALYSPPELNLLPFDNLAERKEVSQTSDRLWMVHGLAQALGPQMGLGLDQAYALVDRLTTSGCSVAKAYKLLLGGVPEGGWLVDKSPCYIDSQSWLERAEKLFEAPRYIHLLRHPMAMIESFVRMRFHRLGASSGSIDPWHSAEVCWLLGNLNATAFLEGVPRERQLRVRFEDLVREPGEVLAAVGDLLGLEERFAAGAQLGGAGVIEGLGDPNLARRDAVDPSLAEAWRENPPPVELCPATVDLARRLGYRFDAAD